MEVTIQRPNGSVVGPLRYESMTQDYGPLDMSAYFQPGANQVRVRILDQAPPLCGGSAVWAVWSGELSPPSQVRYPLLDGATWSYPTSGAVRRYSFPVSNWMGHLALNLSLGSDASLRLIAPDGMIYSEGHPAVRTTQSERYRTLTLDQEGLTAGTWQAEVAVTQAGPESVFSLSAYGKEGDLPGSDVTAPLSAIQFAGEMGRDGWHISEVIATISAQDEPGGSGVATIEWSLDEGETWQPYTGPITLEAEGFTWLWARATDQAGNVEMFPARRLAKIDLTSSLVQVWTDQPTYTRMDPFVTHFHGDDPAPGSGLVNLWGKLAFQIPVSNGQVVDLFWYPLNTYKVEAWGEDRAGWIGYHGASFTLIATLESLQGTTTRLCAEGYVTKPGICNSLQQKLAAARAARDRGQVQTAINILKALQHEVDAQVGKAIKPEGAILLLMDSAYIIERLGGR
jgi:hypothetical protein